MNENKPVEQEIGSFQILILILSVYVLIVLFIQEMFTLPSDVTEILDMMDNFICVIFLGDFFMRLYHAENRLDFLKWGWIDFISSIPMFPQFRVGRLIRVFRVLRLTRGARSVKALATFALKNRTTSGASATALITITVLTWASVSILILEDQPDSNIKNANDALWWAFVTITTVGYGDFFPKTTEGRMVAVVLMFAGMGLLGTFTGLISSWFMGDSQETENEQTKLLREIQQDLKLLQDKVDKLTPNS